MTLYNTHNPVGSSDPRDLYDNAIVIDEFSNSSDETATDRLGQVRKTIRGIVVAANDAITQAGYQFVGDYAAGIELTAYNEVVRDTNGEFWRVSGTEDLPYTTTGAGLPEGGVMLPVGDAALRQELADPAQGGEAVQVTTATGAQTLTEALDNRVIQLLSIAGMQSLNKSSIEDGQQASVLSYNAPTFPSAAFHGGGMFYWDSASTEAANSGTIFASNEGGTGRWKRDVGATVSLYDFGGKTGSGFDNGPLIQEAAEHLNGLGGGRLIIPPGEFYIETPVVYGGNKKGITLLGEAGRRFSVLVGATDGMDMFTLKQGDLECLFKGIHFKSYDVTVNKNITGVYFNPVTGTTANNDFLECRFEGLFDAIRNECSSNTSIEDCYFLRTWRTGLRLGGGYDENSNPVGTSENYVRRCRFTLNNIGTQTGPQVDVRSNAALRMWQVDITGGTYALRAEETGAGEGVANVWCDSAIIGGLSTIDGVRLGAGVQNAMFNGCVFGGASQYGIRMVGGVRNVDINGGMLRGSQAGGARIDGIEGHVSIMNMRIARNNEGDGDDPEVLIAEVPSDGLVIIQNNKIGSKFNPSGTPPTYGVLANQNMAGTVVVKDNTFWGYANGPTSLSTAGGGTYVEEGNTDLGA